MSTSCLNPQEPVQELIAMALCLVMVAYLVALQWGLQQTRVACQVVQVGLVEGVEQPALNSWLVLRNLWDRKQKRTLHNQYLQVHFCRLADQKDPVPDQ
jgi:hypothetical protein